MFICSILIYIKRVKQKTSWNKTDTFLSTGKVCERAGGCLAQNNLCNLISHHNVITVINSQSGFLHPDENILCISVQRTFHFVPSADRKKHFCLFQNKVKHPTLHSPSLTYNLKQTQRTLMHQNLSGCSEHSIHAS